jgi:Beta protein
VAHLSMNSEEQHGIRSIVRKQRHGLGLRVTLSDLAESSVTTKIQHFLLAVTAEPRETILLLDFADASFDDPEAIADLIAESAHRMEAVGKWARLVFEGTHYPSTNPAPTNGIARVRRNEWLAWRHSVEAHPELRRTLMFGD